MGYILPISHFEYTNYQRRDIKDKEGVHYIEKPFKIKLDTQQPLINHRSFSNEAMQRNKEIPSENIKNNIQRQDQLIAKITGKGFLINESI